jgi:hypothetical protein
MPASTLNDSMAFESDLVPTVLVTYAIGTTQYYPMLLEDIYNVHTGEWAHALMTILTNSIEMMHTEMVDGWTHSNIDALVEAISRGDIRVMVRRKDGIEVNLGNTHALTERTKKQYKIAALSNTEIIIVLRIKGFDSEIVLGGDDTKGSDHSPARMSATKYNTSQFMTSRHMMLKSDIPKKVVVKPS